MRIGVIKGDFETRSGYGLRLEPARIAGLDALMRVSAIIWEGQHHLADL